jgi:hypothetical protein
MAKSAITQLQDQIEIIRQDAYNEGYAAAMQAVLNLAKQPTFGGRSRKAAQPAQVSTSKAPARAPVKAPARKAAPETPAPTQTRASRGNNAALIFDALKGLPDQAGRAGDIRKALSAVEVDLSFTSIGHSLRQLQARNQVTVEEDGKTWHATSV